MMVSSTPSLDETAVEHVLGELDRSGVFAGGKAHVLSLKAIREALGKRWAERRAVVWEMTDAQIRRRIGARDFTVRLGDETFLVVTPELDPASAQVLAVRILRDVTTHFLGQTEARDISILVAAGYKGEQLDCRPLTIEELGHAVTTAAQAGDGVSSQSTTNSPAATLVGADENVGEGNLTTLEGRRLRYSVGVSATIDLKHFAIAGHRIEPKISFQDSTRILSPAARRSLLPRDIEAVDMAVLQRGLARLASGQSSDKRPSLILTVSFLSVSNTRARTRLLAEAGKLRDATSSAVIFELADFDDGAPAGRLKEAAALLKPFCRSVFARVEMTGNFVHAARGLGFSGLVADSPLARNSVEDQAIWLLTMGRELEGYKGTTIAANLSTTALLPTAAAAGFTHATLKAQEVLAD